jgi:tripeptidyl-peptidase-1
LGPTHNVSLAGDEADLDFQVAIPLIHPQQSILFQTDDEWYQRNQLQPDTQYPGFFNSGFNGEYLSRLLSLLFLPLLSSSADP